MSYQFNDEDKEVREFTDSLPFGITEVQIMQAEAGVTDAGKDFIELTVTDKDGTEDTARFWFTGGAVNISFNNIRKIAVHCAKEDPTGDTDPKEEARTAIDATKNSDELAAYLNEKCIGGQVWFTKYFDESRTYQAADGSTRRSINKNILGYEPKIKPELMPQKTPAGGNADFPGSKEASADEKANIPNDWS